MKTNEETQLVEAGEEREESPMSWQRLKERLWKAAFADQFDKRESLDLESIGCDDTNTAGQNACDEACDDAGDRVGDDSDAKTARDFALNEHVQALWHQIFPLVGVPASRPGEKAGIFKVTPGFNPGEALVHIDVPAEAYVDGEPPKMDRIVTLTVKLDHDYRLLGDEYYCIDCLPTNETHH